MDVTTLKAGYDDVISLYDIADELAATTESNSVKNIDDHLIIIEPIINDVADACEELAEEYIQLVDQPARGKSVKSKIEKALRKMFMALDKYRESLRDAGTSTIFIFSSLVDPVIAKLQKQIEKITLLFMQLLDISLDRIMRKNELDEFKRSNSKAFGAMSQQLAH